MVSKKLTLVPQVCMNLVIYNLYIIHREEFYLSSTFGDCVTLVEESFLIVALALTLRFESCSIPWCSKFLVFVLLSFGAPLYEFDTSLGAGKFVYIEFGEWFSQIICDNKKGAVSRAFFQPSSLPGSCSSIFSNFL